MKTKPLIETNPYLKDPTIREKLVDRSVISSCGVEGIKVDFSKPSGIKIARTYVNEYSNKMSSTK